MEDACTRATTYHTLDLTMSYLERFVKEILVTLPGTSIALSSHALAASRSCSCGGDSGSAAKGYAGRSRRTRSLLESPMGGLPRSFSSSSRALSSIRAQRADAYARKLIPISSLSAIRLGGAGRQHSLKPHNTQRGTHHAHPMSITNPITTQPPTRPPQSRPPENVGVNDDQSVPFDSHSSTCESSASISNAWKMMRTTRQPRGRDAKPSRRDTTGD